MLIAGEGQVSAALLRRLERIATLRLVATMLDGSGLAVRALKYELVVTSPRDPGLGRVYVEYGTGHVTWDGAVQEHWGILQGFEYDDGGSGPMVSAGRILDVLGADMPAPDQTPARTGDSSRLPRRESRVAHPRAVRAGLSQTAGQELRPAPLSMGGIGAGRSGAGADQKIRSGCAARGTG